MQCVSLLYDITYIQQKYDIKLRKLKNHVRCVLNECDAQHCIYVMQEYDVTFMFKVYYEITMCKTRVRYGI